mmetsp:Transcript_2185/g.4700  ORF Transcript_2185/g.4700 Transcript_2185/m.4700 type:complete len:163 (+) Transcript_2185:105-593(+)
MFMLIDYTTNSILVQPIPSATDKSMINSFTKKINYLTSKGFKPVLNVIDNVASKAIQAHLKKYNIKLQLVEPHTHRINAAERAIQKFKDHFIAGLCATEKDFLAQLWDELIEQAQDSLNMLRTSRILPHLSAYTILEGIHKLNNNPWALPGTRAIIFNPPEL